MQTTNEIETYVELKYFPVQFTEEYFNALPDKVVGMFYDYIFNAHQASKEYQIYRLLLRIKSINQILEDDPDRIMTAWSRDTIGRYTSGLKGALVAYYSL